MLHKAGLETDLRVDPQITVQAQGAAVCQVLFDLIKLPLFKHCLDSPLLLNIGNGPYECRIAIKCLTKLETFNAFTQIFFVFHF